MIVEMTWLDKIVSHNCLTTFSRAASRKFHTAGGLDGVCPLNQRNKLKQFQRPYKTGAKGFASLLDIFYNLIII